VYTCMNSWKEAFNPIVMSRARPLIMICWRIFYSWETTKDREIGQSIRTHYSSSEPTGLCSYCYTCLTGAAYIMQLDCNELTSVIFQLLFTNCLCIFFYYVSMLFVMHNNNFIKRTLNKNRTLSIISVVVDYYLSIS